MVLDGTKQEGPFRLTIRGWFHGLDDLLNDPEFRRMFNRIFLDPRPGDSGHPKRYFVFTAQEDEPAVLQ